jgi:LmbE family N-acetylglucosaminyl deacetylase
VKRLVVTLALALLVAPAPRPLHAQERGAVTLGMPSRGAEALGEALARLPVSARVLLVGAHPDDEDNRLVAWMSRGQKLDVAYLSLTRGDGGQNAIGNELGEALGALRTEELLAARRVDRSGQYFTRAYDYGFSKSADEAFRHWPRDTLLGDVIRVVRDFRPHVIIAVFTGTPRDGHGQHQASGILAREAYELAGDTVRFPRAAFGVSWTPLKFYRNSTYQGHEGATFRYDAGAYDALLGRTYAEIAAVSRAEHRSQAQGSLRPRVPVPGSLKREATRVNAAQDAATERSFLDGIDVKVTRLARGARDAAVRRRLDTLAVTLEALRDADLRRPEAMLPALARAGRLADDVLRAVAPDGGREVARRVADADLATSLQRLQRALGEVATIAGGVWVEATAPREEWVAGRPLPVRLSVLNRGPVPVEVTGHDVGDDDASSFAFGSHALGTVAVDSAWARIDTITTNAVTEPAWLRAPRRGDLYAALTPGLAESPVAAWAEVYLRIPAGTGAVFPVRTPVVYRYAHQVTGEVRRPLAAVPAVSLTLAETDGIARANAAIEREVTVTVRSADTVPRDVRVALALPAGLRADSASRTVTLGGYGAVRTLRFTVRGRLAPGAHAIRATATSGGETFTRGYTLVDHEHIRPQRLYRDAVLRLTAADVALPPGANVAYVPGVGDNSVAALRQLGLPVTVIEPDQVASTSLSRFTAIVVGPRAYDASEALVRQNGALLDWVRRGGTLVVQYGQYEMQRPGMMPYAITFPPRGPGRGPQRVTDEEAEVRILDSTAQVLRWPNRITAADFAGWVQDRTLYMPATHAAEYAAPLSTNDAGEEPNDGALLVARYGRGTYVYTTLAFFRQLPAGVPGAARLFMNLIAAGGEQRD